MSRNTMIFAAALALGFAASAQAADASAFSNTTAFSTGKSMLATGDISEAAGGSFSSIASLSSPKASAGGSLFSTSTSLNAGAALTDAAAAAKFNSIGSMSLLENGSKLNASFRAQ